MKAVIFDAYGTLLDVHSAMRRFAPALGTDWQAISQTWRTKQLEYSWIRSMAHQHRDFGGITRDALEFAAARHGIHDAALLDQVEQAYRQLTAYDEVEAVLRQLRARGLPCAILSNGETTMLGDAVTHAGLAPLLDAVLSVDAVGVFKPDARVYQLAVDRFDARAADMAFLSSNPWDAFGAHHFGFRVFWVNRLQQPAEYGLQNLVTVLPDLQPLLAELA